MTPSLQSPRGSKLSHSLTPAYLVLMTTVALMLAGCSKSLPDPLSQLSRELRQYPEFSVILDDMQITGNFAKSYFHKYKILFSDKKAVETVDAAGELTLEERGWVQVSRKFYEDYESFLGMTVLSKDRGEESLSRVQRPAGYRYVGNERYGQWQSNPSGGSFWVFYGQYALIRDLLGAGTHPISRSGWNSYRGAYSAGRPYYGSGPTPAYGTRGSLTKTRHPTFFERQQLRQSTRSQKFSQRVGHRVGRTQSRGSGRFGGK